MKTIGHGVDNRRAHGAAVLARFADLGADASLKAPLKVFAQVHEAVENASVRAEAARAKRDAVLELVAAQDELLDATLLVLADGMVTAKLGTRVRPFATFSKHSPSALTELAYADEVRETTTLVAQIAKAKPPAAVTKAAAACTKAAAGVEKALKAVPGAQAAYVKALGARDALFLDWGKALGRLKKHAAIALDEEPATLRALFSPADAIVAPVKKRAKKAPTTNASTTGNSAPS